MKKKKPTKADFDKVAENYDKLLQAIKDLRTKKITIADVDKIIEEVEAETEKLKFS